MTSEDNMAARALMDSSVNERRLRPIYDSLDNGNNKKALQEAEKLLKKQKYFQCAKVLKALALIRLGRQEESTTALAEVHAEGPTDDATLQAMTICYRELHKPELIAEAYEVAVKKEPHNEEFLSHLFMAYVRLEDYQKQKQTAMALYKLRPKNPYYFWAVMSIVMQAKSSDEKLAKSTLLPLAERMTDKFIKESKIEAEAEVQLYLMILEDQEKYQEALEVLDGPLGEKLVVYLDFLPKKRAELYMKLKRWPEANSAYKKLIQASPDGWSFYVEYFKSLEELINLIWQPDENSVFDPPVDYTFNMAIEFISSLVKIQDEKRVTTVLRGPYLAQFELLSRLMSRNDPLAATIGDAVEQLMLYFERFGHKPGCFLDMVHVITNYSASEQHIDKLLEKMEQSLKGDGEEKVALPNDSRQMQRHLCFVQLKHWLGGDDDLNPHERLQLARDFIERYYHGLQFGKHLLSTEFQLSDNYCLLAAQLLLELWGKSGDERLLVHIILGLEVALKSSPSNFQIKLLLVKLYNIIGAAGQSESICESLDLKHIQHETLGYLLLQPLLVSAHFSQSSNTLGNTLRFYAGNHKDTIDYLISCYKYGSFTKIPEIVLFREKLNNSLHYASAAVERMILDIMLETKCHEDTERVVNYMEIDPEKDKTEWGKLTDNRDINVFRLWSKKHRELVQELRTKSFQEEVDWLKIRNMVVRILAASFYLTKSYTGSHHNDIANGERRSMETILQEIISMLREHVSSVDAQNLINSHLPLQSPGPSRLPVYLNGGHINVFLTMAEIVLYFHRLSDGSQSGQINEKLEIQMKSGVSESFLKLLQRLKDLCKNDNDSEVIHLCQSKCILEELVNFVETICLCIVLADIGQTILKPARSALMKKGKKKKEHPLVRPEMFQYFSGIVNSIEQAITEFQEMLQTLNSSLLINKLKSLSLTGSDLNFEDSQELMQEVKDKVEKSYRQSLEELEELVQNKLKYVQLLKW